MSLPTTFTPLETRVYEVLCQAKGAARTLAAGRLKPRYYPGQDADNAHREALTAGQASPLGHTAGIVAAVVESYSDGATQEFSDRAHLNARLRVDVAYATDKPAQRSSGAPTIDGISAAITRAMSDSHDIRRALCWPPNMVTTEAGAETGIPGGGGIEFDSAGPPTFDEANNLVKLTIYFRAVVFLAL